METLLKVALNNKSYANISLQKREVSRDYNASLNFNLFASPKPSLVRINITETRRDNKVCHTTLETTHRTVNTSIKRSLNSLFSLHICAYPQPEHRLSVPYVVVSLVVINLT